MEGGFYWPRKYYQGLSKRKQTQRRKEVERRSRLHWRTPRAYRPFKTDVGVKGRRSGYTSQWKKMYPESSGLASASKITGVPQGILRQSYNRGMAAWRTGHRPGATQQQWGYARAYSLLLCGKTYHTTDADLVRKANKTARARKWFRKTCKN
jgi:hypothetical protein